MPTGDRLLARRPGGFVPASGPGKRRANGHAQTVAGTTSTDIGLVPDARYLYSIRGTTTTPEQTFTIAAEGR